MAEPCKKALVLFQGYASRWDGVDWLSISFDSDLQLNNFTAKFKLGNFTFENDDLSSEWIINLTNEQTASLPLGPNTGSLIVYDPEGEGKPFTTSIPVMVKNWVAGDVEIDTYKASVKATLENETQFIIRIETAKVSLEWVEEKIAEHNASEEAHPYIQGRVDTKQDKLIAGKNIIIENNVISATGGNFNIDGGKANSVYTIEQDINGGNAQWQP